MRRTALAGDPNQGPSSVSDVPGSLAPVERTLQYASSRASASSSDSDGPIENRDPSSVVPRLPPREFARSALGGLAFGAVCIGLLQIPLGPPTSTERSGQSAHASGAEQTQVMAHPAPHVESTQPVVAVAGSQPEQEPPANQFVEDEQPASEAEVQALAPALPEQSAAESGPAQLSASELPKKVTAQSSTASPAAGQSHSESPSQLESAAAHAGPGLRAGKVKRHLSADAPTGRFPATRE